MDRASMLRAGAMTLLAGATMWTNPALADPFSMFARPPAPLAAAYAPERTQPYGLYEPPMAVPDPAQSEAAMLPEHLQRQVVAYRTSEAPGTIVVDTRNTFLYYVLGGGRAVRYGIGVGRDGFTWSGVHTVTRTAEWPDWTPPVEMLERQPYLPRFVAGGPGNPLGARALYIGNTAYRIHGTNDPTSIGKRVSSGCIRMLNEDVIDLYARAGTGSKVVVMPGAPSLPAAANRMPTFHAQEAAIAGQPSRLY